MDAIADLAVHHRDEDEIQDGVQHRHRIRYLMYYNGCGINSCKFSSIRSKYNNGCGITSYKYLFKVR